MEIFDQFAFSLEPGTYSIKFFYDPSSIDESISYKLIDFDQVSEDNNSGVTIASGTIEQGSDSTYLEFSLEDASTELRFAFSKEFSFYSYTLTMLSDQFSDVIIIVLTWIVLAGFIEYLYKSRRFDLLGLLCVVFVISIPVFGKCLYTGPDLDFHLSRIKGVADGLASLQIPVRVNYNFFYGIGSADPIFYPNLWLYIPAFLKLLGASLVFSYQYFIFLIHCATAFLTYLAFKRWTSNNIVALVITIFYLCNPFRLNDVYIRFALGESLALTFLPLFFVSLFSILFDGEKRWKILAISAFGILHSHLLSVGVTAAVSVIVFFFALPGIIRTKHFERVIPIGKALFTVLLSSLWFLVPLIDKMGMDLGILASNYISNSTLNPLAMFSFDNYFNMSTTMGVGFGVLLLTAFVMTGIVYKRCDSNSRQKIGCCVCLIGLCIYFASNYFPWTWLSDHMGFLIDKINNLQFVWRIHGYTVVFGLMLFGYVLIKGINLKISFIQNKFNAFFGLLVCLLVLDCYNSLYGVVSKRVIELNGRSETVKYSTLLYYDYYDSEFGNVSFETVRDKQNQIQSSDPLSIQDSKQIGNRWEFEITSGKDNHIIVPWYDYGFYLVYVDGIETPIDSNSYFVEFDIPSGTHSVTVRYEERKLYLFADVVSGVWILYLCVAFIRKNKEKHKGI